MRACILVRVGPGKAASVAAWMRRTPGVTTAFPAFGAADVAARAEVATRADLLVLVGKVASLPGVLATETLPELEGVA